MKKNIFISIILCSYNSEKFIIKTLNSIINQSYKHWELIIVDDGSSDNSGNIIKNFIKFNKNFNIKYYYKNNSGLALSRNFAIRKSIFEWIALIDHDDIWESNKLKIQIDDIISQPTSYLFFSDFKIIKNNEFLYTKFDICRTKDNFIPTKLILKKHYAYLNLIKYGCFIGSSTVLFNKKVFEKISFFNSKYKFICDYIFFMETAKEYDIFCNNNTLASWSQHQDQSSFKLEKVYFKEMLDLYNSIYFNKTVNIMIKIIILKRHVKLLISFYFKKYVKKKF